MTAPLSLDERRKLGALRRVKLLATLALAGCVALLVAAKMLEPAHPAFAYLAAFAEAAAIGGVADWYAVVALFRRPLGLPIPHTAIVTRNQDRIGDNLGAFIETNFLAPEPVEKKLRELDFAREISRWLSDRSRAESLARFAARLAPQMLAAMEETGLKQFTAERVKAQLAKVDVAPMVAEALNGLAASDRHQQVMDELLSALHGFLSNDESVDALRKRIARELPAVLNRLGADALILRRILSAASDLIDNIRNDPAHELRAEFGRFFRTYVEELKDSEAFHLRVEQAKQRLLSRSEISSVTERIWESLRAFVETDAQAENPILAERLTALFVDIGSGLAEEPKLSADINAGMVAALSTFVAAQKRGVAAFAAEQVKSWDFKRLTLLIEANVGRDLQYIRFNGMIVGGLAGLGLHILLVQVLGF